WPLLARQVGPEKTLSTNAATKKPVSTRPLMAEKVESKEAVRFWVWLWIFIGGLLVRVRTRTQHRSCQQRRPRKSWGHRPIPPARPARSARLRDARIPETNTGNRGHCVGRGVGSTSRCRFDITVSVRHR